MNGAQQTKDTTAQKPPQVATPPASANGNSALNKKRKKDGLKPIITTEGPGYVHCAFYPAARINRCLKFFCHGSRRRLHPALGISRFGDRLPSTLPLRALRRAPWTSGGVRRAGHGPTEGKAQRPSVPSCCDITQRGCMGLEIPRREGTAGGPIFACPRLPVAPAAAAFCIVAPPPDPPLTCRTPTPPAARAESQLPPSLQSWPTPSNTLFRWSPLRPCSKRSR